MLYTTTLCCLEGASKYLQNLDQRVLRMLICFFFKLVYMIVLALYKRVMKNKARHVQFCLSYQLEEKVARHFF